MNKFDEVYNRIIMQAGTFKNQPKLAKEILNCQSNQYFDKKKILFLIRNDFNLKQNIKRNVKLIGNIGFIVIKFNQISIQQIENVLFQYKEQMKNEQFTKQVEEIYQNFINSNALFFLFNDKLFMALNMNKVSNDDIYHQFTHYIQPFIKENLTNVKQFSDQQILYFQKQLQQKLIILSTDRIKYFLNVVEIIPHINQLCSQLNVFKQKFFLHKSRSSFIENLFKILSYKYPTQTEFAQLYFKNFKNNAPLIVFLIVNILNLDKDHINNIIRKYFQ